ncbi:MAG TPA: formyltransferase family protein [Acidimicrobiia bacterium]|jgi:methionyl-tRNA formyltransferase
MTRLAFAGNRTVAVSCLEHLLEVGVVPHALMIPSANDVALQDLAGLPPERVLVGSEFRQEKGIELLRSLDLDYILGVHFPYIVPDSVLEIPRIGALNLHPALLPHNRGWHTPSWAILDGTPIGATLHFMDSGVDTGDIVAQAELEIRPEDTAHTLYSRLLELEVELFRTAWPLLASGNPPRTTQSPDEGTSHNRRDLAAASVSRLDLEKQTTAREMLRTLRGLTTNDIAEAAYFEQGGRRYRVQIAISVDDPPGEEDR